MNPTTLDQATFLDVIPLVRALSFGVSDGYPSAHYRVVADRARAGDPLFVGAAVDPHPAFLAPTYRTEACRDDATHRSAALAAIPVDVALALAALDAAAAEAAGLCPVALWPRVRGDLVARGAVAEGAAVGGSILDDPPAPAAHGA